MRILLIEDHSRFGPLLQEQLSDAGYTVDLAVSVAEFREMANAFSYALYVLDLGLPDGDGRQIISLLRSARQTAPIIVTSACAYVSDRIASLSSGADDYLVKPFHRAELLARIRALLRRQSDIAAEYVHAGNLICNSGTGEVTCHGRRLGIRPTERRLLALLMRRKGQLVPRRAIEYALTTDDDCNTSNAIEKVVSRLRAALASEHAGVRIRTIRGLGYELEVGPRHN